MGNSLGRRSAIPPSDPPCHEPIAVSYHPSRETLHALSLPERWPPERRQAKNQELRVGRERRGRNGASMATTQHTIGPLNQ
jgi:hypothetical protein